MVSRIHDFTADPPTTKSINSLTPRNRAGEAPTRPVRYQRVS